MWRGGCGILCSISPSSAASLFSDLCAGSLRRTTPSGTAAYFRFPKHHFLSPSSSALLSKRVQFPPVSSSYPASSLSAVTATSFVSHLGGIRCHPSLLQLLPSSREHLSYQSRSISGMASQSAESAKSIHDFVVKDARGNDVDLSTYKGKALLIVNVASQCGLTNSNYMELSQLYEKYKNKDFEILAFPCNQFGGQEPGSNEEIIEFACTRYKAEYPIFDKVDVNGENAAPVYKFLKSSKGGLLGDNIKWNFSKFLVDKEGNVVDRYAPTTTPLTIEKDIKKLLGLS